MLTDADRDKAMIGRELTVYGDAPSSCTVESIVGFPIPTSYEEYLMLADEQKFRLYEISKKPNREGREMNKATHTPGPWHIGQEQDYSVDRFKRNAEWARIRNAENGLVATVESVHPKGKRQSKDFDIEAANARLIAAAPDMLAALKEAREVLETAGRYFPKSIMNGDRFRLTNVLANAVNKAIETATV